MDETAVQERPGIRILLVEDDADYAEIICEYLSHVGDKHYLLIHRSTLKAALDTIREERPDLVLMDLNLPDSRGLITFQQLRLSMPSVPIILLTAVTDKALALEAIRAGAQDFLFKHEINLNVLSKSMDYAIERHRLQNELQALSLKDDLTGLFNRRGFYSLAEHQLKIHLRYGRDLTLFFIDVDNLKTINDRFGHLEGDKALVDTAVLLRRTFRISDVLGRVGGDEFAVLALESGQSHAKDILFRIGTHLSEISRADAARPYQISLSIGYAFGTGTGSYSIDSLLHQADQMMYLQKKEKRR